MEASMNFKDYFKMDSSAFFNLNEFAEEHLIDGKKYTIIVDNEKAKELNFKYDAEVYAGEVLFYIRAEEIAMPKPFRIMDFDNVKHQIVDVKKIDDIYEIVLIRND
jgi:hypothetical protein